MSAVRHVPSIFGHCVKTTVCLQRHGTLRRRVACTPHRGLHDIVVGFKASLGKVIKIVKISQSMGDDDKLEKLVRKIRSEVLAKPRNVNSSSVTMFMIRLSRAPVQPLLN